MEGIGTYIHPTVAIDRGTFVGEGTKIWHNSHISEFVYIGSHCVIGQNVFVGAKVVIGRGCKIQNNVSIFKASKIGKDVFIGPGTTFTNVKNPRAFINRKNEFKPIIVKNGASIGANATLVCGITIGEYAMIGAGAVVTKDVGPHEVAFGNPAKVVGMISSDGNKIVYNGVMSVLKRWIKRGYVWK